MTSITIVTPWLDAHELAPSYWRAMSAGMREDDRCVIVDNGSTPKLWESIHQDAGRPENILSVRLDVNAGFSRASNLGLAEASQMDNPTDAVLFLNNDVRMTSATWLTQIRQALKPGVLVGARLRSEPHTMVDGQVIPYLDGWCVAGLTAELVELGGWNEEFDEPSYFGDNELCVRARQAGMRLVGASVGLQHLENYTSRRMDVTGVSARNRERYLAAARLMLATEVAG